jgi:hypothetical protein
MNEFDRLLQSTECIYIYYFSIKIFVFELVKLCGLVHVTGVQKKSATALCR